MNFCERVKFKREKLGFTQAALAVEINKYCILTKITRSAIGMWETQDSIEISGVNLLRLSLALKVSPYWLLFGENKQWSLKNKILIPEEIFNLIKSKRKI